MEIVNCNGNGRIWRGRHFFFVWDGCRLLTVIVGWLNLINVLLSSRSDDLRVESYGRWRCWCDADVEHSLEDDFQVEYQAFKVCSLPRISSFFWTVNWWITTSVYMALRSHSSTRFNNRYDRCCVCCQVEWMKSSKPFTRYMSNRTPLIVIQLQPHGVNEARKCNSYV